MNKNNNPRGLLEIFRNEQAIRYTLPVQEKNKSIVYIAEAFDLTIPSMIHLGEYDYIGKARLTKIEQKLFGLRKEKIWVIESGKKACYFICQGISTVGIQNIPKTPAHVKLSYELSQVFFDSSPPALDTESYHTSLNKNAQTQNITLEQSLLDMVFEPIDTQLMQEYKSSVSRRYSFA